MQEKIRRVGRYEAVSSIELGRRQKANNTVLKMASSYKAVML